MLTSDTTQTLQSVQQIKTIPRGITQKPELFFFVGFPLFWMLGVEQIGLIVIAIWLFNIQAKRGHFGKKYIFLRTTPFIVFFFVFIVSFTSVSTPVRIISYSKDALLYVSGYFLMGAVYLSLIYDFTIERLAKGIVIFSMFVCILGLSYFIIGNWSFKTPIGYVLPESLSKTQLGQSIAVRTIGRSAYFFGLDARLSSIYLTSAQLALGLTILMPTIISCCFVARGKTQLYAMLLVPCIIVMIILAQGRVSIIVNSFTLALYPILYGVFVKKRIGTDIIWLGASLALVLVFFLLFTNIAPIEEAFNTYFIEARGASADHRFHVYTETIKSIFHSNIWNLLFGFGTQRDFANSPVPLGSHSYYLGVLYKQGILGFLSLIWLFGWILKRCFQAMNEGNDLKERHFALGILLSFLGVAISVTAIEPIVDATNWHVFSILIAYPLAAKSRNVIQTNNRQLNTRYGTSYDQN